MPKKPARPAAPKLRADAQRNRDRILTVAREVFKQRGADASMDEIAREAQVGPGTLYRHFPTRDALIEAVFHSSVQDLAAAAQKFSDEHPPVVALRNWLLYFVDYLAAKLIIGPALNSITGGPSRLYEGSKPAIGGAMQMLVSRGINSGELRPDLRASDLHFALVGLAHMPFTPDWLQNARRLVDLLISGARQTPLAKPIALAAKTKRR